MVNFFRRFHRRVVAALPRFDGFAGAVEVTPAEGDVTTYIVATQTAGSMPKDGGARVFEGDEELR